MTLRRQSFSPITRVLFLALVLVVTRVRSSTLPRPFPDLNPISLLSTILHAPPPTSFTAFLAVNVANFTSVERADVYLTDLLNTSPISGGSDSRKRHEKPLIFKIGTIHPHGLNERFSFLLSLHSFCFCLASGDFSLFTPLFMFIHLPLIHFAPPPSLMIDFKNSK